ncbi:hypothetical protein JCM18918_1000 [Cutibacterium acnes JCM 18918]|nr:hypothetical protein JCM18918_1000 [Cutibacterium acnes JCM 18918]
MPRIIQIRVMGFTSADISRSIHKTTRQTASAMSNTAEIFTHTGGGVTPKN